MIIKTRTYLQNHRKINQMIETVIDETLNIFITNVYLKATDKDVKESWVLAITSSFCSAKEAEATYKDLLAQADRGGFWTSGTTKKYYSLKSLGQRPTWNEKAFLIQAYAEQLLKAITKLPARFYNKDNELPNDYTNYLVERALAYNITEDKLRAYAKDYIKNTGYTLTVKSNDTLDFQRTK